MKKYDKINLISSDIKNLKTEYKTRNKNNLLIIPPKKTIYKQQNQVNYKIQTNCL